jgi:imidazolonepropionase-like amidohydrolase
MRSRSRYSYLWLSVALLACDAGDDADIEPVIAITGATIFDGTGSEPISDGAIIVRGQRIVCVGTAEDCPVPTDATAIDASGKYITPGMVDAHVHFFQTGFFDGRPDALDLNEAYPFPEVIAYQQQNPERYYEAYLCAGITAVYDVGGMSWSVGLQEHAESRSGAPHVAASGPLITPVQGIAFDLPSDKALVPLNSAEDGIRTVQYLSALNSTGVKFWQLRADDDEYMQRVEATAEEIGRTGNVMIAHATTLEQAKAALRNGTKLLVHSVSDREVDDEFIGLALENGAVYNPTLIVSSGYVLAYRAVAGIEPFEINDPNGCVDERTRELLETASRFSDHSGLSDGLRNRIANFDPATERVRDTDAANLRRVYEAGIPIAVGTDAGNPGTLHGISIFDELEAMQAAGIPAADLIVMATRNGAQAMQRLDDFGTLEERKVANLIILDRDPSEDISNMRSLRWVMIRGNVRTMVPG